MNNLLVRAFVYTLGLTILSLGVVLMIKSDVGIAPWDALNVVLTDRIGLTIGSWVFIVGGILIFINSLIRLDWPNVLCFIPIIIIGLIVDIINLKILGFIDVTPLTLRWPLFLFGLTTLGFGIALYLRSALPAVPNDELMLALRARTGWSKRTTKTIGEAFACVLAFSLKGPIGLGTFIVVIFLGWFVASFDKWFDSVGVPKSQPKDKVMKG